jgi:hypothetical protein
MKHMLKSLLITAALTTSAAFATIDNFLVTEAVASPGAAQQTMLTPFDILSTAQELHALVEPDFNRLVALCGTPEATPEHRDRLKALQVHGLERVAALYELCLASHDATPENIQEAQLGLLDIEAGRAAILLIISESR